MCVSLSGQMCGLELIRVGVEFAGDEKITSAIRPDVFAIWARGVRVWGEREGEEQYMQDHHLMVKGGGSETNVMNGDAMVGGGGVGLGGYSGLQAVSAAELESQHRLLQTDHLLHPHHFAQDQVNLRGT